MLYREIMAVFAEKHAQYINALWRQIVKCYSRLKSYGKRLLLSVTLSVLPSVCKAKLGFRWTDFGEICTANFNVICREISVCLQSDQKKRETVEETLSARMTALFTNVTMVGVGRKGWHSWSILICFTASCDLDGTT